jgi:hypothetical protein
MADREYTAKDAQPIVNYGYKGTALYPFQIDDDGNLRVVEGTIVPDDYDYIEYGYTDTDLTSIVYKTGGVGGTTVMTKTMAYDANHNITSITIT